jgi:ribosome-binding factor A
MTRRTDRLGEQFRQEIGRMLQLEVKDPRIGFATISRVDVTPDLDLARVMVSVMGSDKEKRDSLIGLKQSSGFIRKALGRKFHLRKIPRLDFRLDENLDHGLRIAGILDELRSTGGLGDGEKD